MHIPRFMNNNQPIIDENNPFVPLNYFNIVELKQNETFVSRVSAYETCIVPATGTIDVNVGSYSFKNIGNRRIDVWDGEPEGVYIPTAQECEIKCASANAEIFVSGAKYQKILEPFEIRKNDLDIVQYGSDETKTHRKIKHILGQRQTGRVGRLLVSELFTVGAGGWSGFPSHKHDTDRLPIETHHDETYNFRFRPSHGSGVQLVQFEDKKTGEAFHISDGSTICLSQGYHPCCALPGYEMYYFTILGGFSQRPLIQFFQPTHDYQVETIPGIKDMIAKFK